MLAIALFGLALASLAPAAKLTVNIPSSPPSLPNPATLPPSTHAVLIGPPGVRLDAPLRRDNSFRFDDIQVGSYLLTVYARDHFFPPLRVDVSASAAEGPEKIEAWQTFRGNEWDNKGPRLGSGKGDLKIDVRPAGVKDFYQERGGFNILGFLKSPMILMALFSMVMVFGMPYLMENMDPETKKEFEEMQRSSPLTGEQGAANQIQNFDLAGFLAGKSSGSDANPGGARKR